MCAKQYVPTQANFCLLALTNTHPDVRCARVAPCVRRTEDYAVAYIVRAATLSRTAQRCALHAAVVQAAQSSCGERYMIFPRGPNFHHIPIT